MWQEVQQNLDDESKLLAVVWQLQQLKSQLEVEEKGLQ